MKIWQEITFYTVIVIVCFIVGFGIIVAFVIGISNPPVAVSSPSSPSDNGAGTFAAPVRFDGRVMSVSEFQEWLAKRGYYKGKIDGWVSKDYINSLTQIAWDAAYNDQCGVEDMKVALGGGG